MGWAWGEEDGAGLLALFLVVVAGLGYVYTGVMRLPRGCSRVLAVAPLLPLLVLLPWRVPLHQARAVVAFQFLWVCPSKLALLCWDRSVDHLPWLLSSFPRFLLAMLLPVRIVAPSSRPGKFREKKGCGGLFSESGDPNLLTGFLALLLLLNVYRFGDSLPTPLVYLAYSFHVYLGLGLVVGGIGSVVSRTAVVETQACFLSPFAASSLGDFWGRRWNLLVNSLLRSTVYNPLLGIMLQAPPSSSPNKPYNRLVEMYSERLSPPSIQLHLTPPNTPNNLAKMYSESPSIQPYPAPNKPDNLVETYSESPSIQPLPPPFWARAIASMAVFLVSGLVHELIFFYLHKSTAYFGHYLAFFLLHGIATTLEFSLKKNLPPRWRISEFSSWLCTLLFIYVTACWLFFPVLTKTRIAMDTIDEYFRLESFLISLLRTSS